LEAFFMTAARSRTGLALAPGLELPLDIVTDTIGVLAMKGSGKTYTALVLLEQMVGASLPVVALDPVGVFWGLRSSADGRGPGLPVILLGGRHADAPLEPGAGRAVADFIIAERQPTVLDLSEFRSKAEQQRFTREFLERLTMRTAMRCTS
jgi:DNA helicase HerA-like ATPase